MTKISYSPSALRDLEQIGDYIVEKLKSPVAARDVVDKIQDAIDKLADFPKMGTPLSARYEDVADYRFLVCDSYLAFYRVKEDTEDIVYIDRILYGRRDYLKILFGEWPENEGK